MATRVVAIVAVMMVAGCGGNAEYRCGPDHTCGAGMCEVTGFCSVFDTTCPSGRRYTDGLAGNLSGQCVGGEGPSDAGVDARIDAPPDARLFCYGTAPISICFAAAPAGSKMYSGTLDTTTSSMCATDVVSGGTGLCVLAAGTINIDGRLRATGTKPLVLLATDSITTTTAIDVGSHRGATPETGAGADPATCATMAGTPPTIGGGGAGGSFVGPGGAGAVSALANSTSGISGAGVNITNLALRGGCPGQDGEGTGKGTGGHGGGAILLIATNSITLGADITAGGEGGDGGSMNSSGGGGGGAGGMIWLDAPAVTNIGNNLILANGGAGGEGSGVNAGATGNPGADGTTLGAAPGGRGGVSNGGDGGDGSAGAAAGAGNAGFPGQTGGGLPGGGGGGGGGAGIVKARMVAGVDLGTKVSPAMTPQ